MASIEAVVKCFTSLYDVKMQMARENADKAIVLDVDNLEASETPESASYSGPLPETR